MEFMMSQIEIVLNGQKKLIEKSLTIAELVAETSNSDKGVAIACNGQVIRKLEWDSHHIVSGDVIEVISAVQGG
jgi:sulfur carrier protein